MNCPKCNHDKTSVLATRKDRKVGETRRRECPICGVRFTTIEIVYQIGNTYDRRRRVKLKNLFQL
jgi:transcriptional regulator NrdR family protein